MILGARKRENSVLASVFSVGRWRVRDLAAATSEEVAYATIHSFKGLERPVVVVIEAGNSNAAETEFSPIRRDVTSACTSLRTLPRGGKSDYREANAGRNRRYAGCLMKIGLKVQDASTVREHIIDSLRRELVGPSPGYPLVQINGEEVLRPQDPPRYRYACGILFPKGVTYSGSLSVTEEEKDIETADAVTDEIGLIAEETLRRTRPLIPRRK